MIPFKALYDNNKRIKKKSKKGIKRKSNYDRTNRDIK